MLEMQAHAIEQVEAKDIQKSQTFPDSSTLPNSTKSNKNNRVPVGIPLACL